MREGAENVPIRYSHWQDIFSAYAEKIRETASATAQNLLNEVIAARQNSPGGSVDVPLLMQMDESTFSKIGAPFKAYPQGAGRVQQLRRRTLRRTPARYHRGAA